MGREVGVKGGRYNGFMYALNTKDHYKMEQTVIKRGTACFLALTLVIGVFGSCLIGTSTAYAEPPRENTGIDKLLAEAQERIEQTAQDYDNAVAKAEALQKQIEENEKKIKELEKALPAQEEKSASALVALYKMQQNGFSLVNMVLSTGSLSEFLSSIEYINTIHQTNVNEITRLRLMKEELQNTKDSLRESKLAVDAEKSRAEIALKEAQEAREEAQRKALEEAARQEAARQAEIARKEAAEKAAAGESDSDGGGSSSPGTGGGSTTPPVGGVDWSIGKDAFIDSWGARIDAYLAGSPLGGQGRTFAEAAWNYGVDPRFSPAISCTESSKGRYCFLPHNAWGWGNISWSNWGDAINSHVRGLANGYGGTLSLWGAQKYCPPNWQHWYNTVLSEMNKI